MTHRKHGFSLTEVLVALVIMSIVGSIVAIAVAGQIEQARISATEAQIRTLANAVRLFQSQQGFLPTQQQGLEALVQAPSRPPLAPRFPEGGYLESRQVPVDAWGNPFLYLIPGRGGEAFEIISYGRDGIEGGTGPDADISSSDL